MKKNSIQNLVYRSYSFGNTWASGIFSGPYSVGNLPLWFKIIHPGLLTSDYFLLYFRYIVRSFLPLLHMSSFAQRLTNGVSILILSFKLLGVSSKFHELLLMTICHYMG